MKSKSKQQFLLPTCTRVLIKCPRTSEEAKSERQIGGVWVPAPQTPEQAAALQESHMLVDVLAVGPECKRIKEGDRVVVLMRQTWVIRKLEGFPGEHTYVEERDILAVVR